MKIQFTDIADHAVAFVGVGVAKAGDVLDVAEKVAQNLIREGKAKLFEKPKSTPKVKPEEAKE